MTATRGAGAVRPPSVRVASAGTGKTTSLVLRYLDLIGGGVPLRRIAGVTFTRAAAAELRQRVGQAIEEVLMDGSYLSDAYVLAPAARPNFVTARNELSGALLTTIHGFMDRALRLNAPHLGVDPSFGRIEEWEAVTSFATGLRSLLLVAQESGHPLHDAAMLLGDEAERWALNLFNKRSLAERFTFGLGPSEQALRLIYEAALRAHEELLGGTALGPSEVERRALALLHLPVARERLAERYPRVLVDEYQDVNPMQGRFFTGLAEAGVKLEVVGDPKQSIYGFRHADVTVFRRALLEAERHGLVEPPLAVSRRHSRAVLSFLNLLTTHLGAEGKGFAAAEAPSVGSAGPQAHVPGSVEFHEVRGTAPLAELRRHEARVLAERLREHHRSGVPYEQMAVLARSYASLAAVERELSAQGIPNVLFQGRGYYERPEIRDVHHALAVGVDPTGESLAPFLRGPVAGLEPGDIAEVLAREGNERMTLLEARFPGVHERVVWLRELASLPPLDALTRLLREQAVAGKHLIDYLGIRERENLDALLFDVASNPPADISLLLERLQLFVKRADAGDVPQLGAGVKLLTIHASKGLEFGVVALYDTSRGNNPRAGEVLVDPRTSTVLLRGHEGYAEGVAAEGERSSDESYRLLYVACSRARDTLILTGSVRLDRLTDQPIYRGWLSELTALKLPAGIAGCTISAHNAPGESETLPANAATVAHRRSLPPAPYIGKRYPAVPYPPVVSPSRLAALAHEEGSTEEPLPAAVLSSAEREVEAGRIGWGRARGTLVHYSISQDWRPGERVVKETLLAQEVLFPFGEAQKEELVSEVLELLAAYWQMVGTSLPALEDREVDRAELPLVVRRAPLVWEGVVDRLYRVAGEWFVDDYKTDATLAPERYYVQLGLYLEALSDAIGLRPRGRLVFLRAGVVIEPERAELETAVERAAPGF